MRRALSVLAIIAVIVIVILAGWYFSRNRGSPSQEEQPSATTPAKLPPVPAFSGGKSSAGNQTTGGQGTVGGPNGTASRFGVVVQNPIAAYYITPQNAVLLVQPDGVVAQVVGTNQTVLSDKKIDGLLRASFSADGQKALVVLGDQNNPETRVFDIATKTWRTLSSDIKAPVWSPNDERIAFLSSNSSTSFSVIATLDLKNAKAQAVPILQIYAQDLVLDWTGKSEVVVSEKSSSYAPGSVWRLDLTTKNMTPLATDLSGALLSWSGEAQRGALFTATPANRGGNLSIIQSDGRVTSRLMIVTIPTKCTFLSEFVTPTTTASSTTSSTTSTKKTAKTKAPQPKEVFSLVCGFPQNVQDFNLNAEPDAYFEHKFYSEDSLYKIDLGSGVLTNLYPENSSYVFDATQLSIVNNRLFFVSRYDSKLYALDLGKYVTPPPSL